MPLILTLAAVAMAAAVALVRPDDHDPTGDRLAAVIDAYREVTS